MNNSQGKDLLADVRAVFILKDSFKNPGILN